MFVACAVTRNHVEGHDNVLLLTMESKEVTPAVISMTADPEWRERDMVDFCDNHLCPLQKPPKRTLQFGLHGLTHQRNWHGTAEVEHVQSPEISF